MYALWAVWQNWTCTAYGIQRNETKQLVIDKTKQNEYCNLWKWKPQVSQAHVTSLLCKLTFSRADMCLNGIVFKALKKIGYGATAKKSFKCEK